MKSACEPPDPEASSTRRSGETTRPSDPSSDRSLGATGGAGHEGNSVPVVKKTVRLNEGAGPSGAVPEAPRNSTCRAPARLASAGTSPRSSDGGGSADSLTRNRSPGTPRSKSGRRSSNMTDLTAARRCGEVLGGRRRHSKKSSSGTSSVNPCSRAWEHCCRTCSRFYEIWRRLKGLRSLARALLTMIVYLGVGTAFYVSTQDKLCSLSDAVVTLESPPGCAVLRTPRSAQALSRCQSWPRYEGP